MANAGRRRILGRLTTALGLIWILWSILIGSGLVDLELGEALVDLPILPGIVLLFVGRLIGRGQRGGDEAEESQTAPPRPAAEQKPPPRPTRSRVMEIESAPEPEAAAVAEAIENMGDEIAESVSQTTRRKTSAEMVAEARERFGRRAR